MSNATATERHEASVLCDASVQAALAFLADGVQLGRWALGCWDTRAVDDGLVRGHSLFDGQAGWVRPVVDATLGTVTYHVGGAPGALQPRIVARVEAGQDWTQCRITLEAERQPDMDDARWLRLARCHEVEVLLIQAQLAARGRAPMPPG